MRVPRVLGRDPGVPARDREWLRGLVLGLAGPTATPYLASQYLRERSDRSSSGS
jgi:hypothetical protein